jgi:RNA polymerase sigma-70 factor (ECF subfamily)
MEPGSRLEAESEQPREIDDLTLRRAQRGDERACRDLVGHYQRPVFALLGRLLCGAGRRGQVEDLAQETFLRVFRELPRFTIMGAARLSTWILTIATRLALDELRRRRPALVPLRDAGEIPAPGRPDDVAERRDLCAAIERAAAGLPAESRAVLLLRDVHDLEYQEIARALEIDLGTVKSRLWRARAAIRAAVGAALQEPPGSVGE